MAEDVMEMDEEMSEPVFQNQIGNQDTEVNHDWLDRLEFVLSCVENDLKVPLEELFKHTSPDPMIEIQETGVSSQNSMSDSLWKEKIAPFLLSLSTLGDMAKDRHIGLVGERGRGKSSTINSIIGHQLFPTALSRACTAVVSSVSRWDREEFQVLVYFISKKELEDERKIVLEYLEEIGESSHLDEPSFVKAFREKIQVLSGSSNLKANIMPKIEEEWNKQYATSSFTDANAARKYINSYVDKQSFWWPLVQRVYIKGPFKKLPAGVCLLDIPGIEDGNESLTSVATSAMSQCDSLFWTCIPQNSTDPQTIHRALGLRLYASHVGLVITRFSEQMRDQEFEDSGLDPVNFIRNRMLEHVERRYHEDVNSLPIYGIENIGEEKLMLSKFVDKELLKPALHEGEGRTNSLISIFSQSMHFLEEELKNPLSRIIPKARLQEVLNSAMEDLSKLSGLYTTDEFTAKFAHLFHTAVEVPIPTTLSSDELPSHYGTLQANLRGNSWLIAQSILNKFIDTSRMTSALFESVALSPVHVNESLSKNLFRPLQEYPKCEQLKEVISNHVGGQLKKANTQLLNRRHILLNLLLDAISQKMKQDLWINEKLRMDQGRGLRDRLKVAISSWFTKHRDALLNLIKDTLLKWLRRHLGDYSSSLVAMNKDLQEQILQPLMTEISAAPELDRICDILQSARKKLTTHILSSGPEEDATIEELQETPPNLANLHERNHLLSPIPKSYLNKITHLFPGYVYILSNKGYKTHLIKIGRTERAPNVRTAELFTTGVPEPFAVEAAWKTPQNRVFETIMHKLFKKQRHRPNREFFNVPLSLALEVGKWVEQEINRLCS